MATIKIKDGNDWVGIDALKGDPGESVGITAGSENALINHLTDGAGILFAINNGDLTIDNDIRASVRSSEKATNGRPSGEKATREALDMQQLTFDRVAYNISTDCLTPGFYPLAKGTTNYPSGAEEYGSVMVVPHYERYTINDSTGEYSKSVNDGKFCTQVYFTDGNDGVAGDAIFFRGRNSNLVNSTTNWEPWKKLLTNQDLQLVDALPASPNANTIYIVKGPTPHIYLGSTQIV